MHCLRPATSAIEESGQMVGDRFSRVVNEFETAPGEVVKAVWLWGVRQPGLSEPSRWSGSGVVEVLKQPPSPDPPRVVFTTPAPGNWAHRGCQGEPTTCPSKAPLNWPVRARVRLVGDPGLDPGRPGRLGGPLPRRPSSGRGSWRGGRGPRAWRPRRPAGPPSGAG